MDEMRDDGNVLSKADSGSERNVRAETSCTFTASGSGSSSNQNLHANLWNKFLRSISQQHETVRKYPNPNVPEFYPRNVVATPRTGYLNASVSKSDQTNGKYSTSNVPPKQESLVLMSQQCIAAAANESSDSNVKTVVDASRDVVRGREVTRYYWTFSEPGADRTPHVITYKSDRLEIKTTQPPPIPIDRTIKPPTSNDQFRSELGKKDTQLLHLNNVVKALLEEIWRINELLMKHRNKDQLKTDIMFAIDEMLKPSSELGFHCDDCCDKFKQFVVKTFKQQERKIAKQQAHYKDIFIDYLVSIIENSLEAFSQSDRVHSRLNSTLAKRDVATQTEQLGHDDQRKPYKRAETRRSKHQMTKIYRNRNYHKVYDARGNNAALDPSNWYTATATATAAVPIVSYPGTGHLSQKEKRNRLSRQQFQPCAYSYSSQRTYKTSTPAAVQQASFCDSQTTNPIQLIHQKYKNLNCRLEGIPDKNLVKFSYIVNDKEYSAIASTKKDAQYHCAWHVLGATNVRK